MSAAFDGADVAEQDPRPLADLAARVERVAAPLREQVLELLRQEIIEMRLRPGQRLVERELVERIGVSRTTIREAIRQLAAEGLVTTIPQKGAIVAAPTMREAQEVYEVRALLEGLAGRQFAERASDEQVRALRLEFEAVAASEAADPRVMLQAKNRFYEVLFEGAGNATIRLLLQSLQARVSMLRATTISAPGRPRESVEEIGAIIEAIERRDPDAAAHACTHHVRRAAECLFSHITTPSATDDVAEADGR